ncbi:hypothetical protein B0H10DRAFT_2436438 [Mycena sp. CBHHK59/15]|nr:hypothetical protein B0H10DRAFT_2436438 [Mycena sp. CBHHK59/15]
MPVPPNRPSQIRFARARAASDSARSAEAKSMRSCDRVERRGRGRCNSRGWRGAGSSRETHPSQQHRATQASAKRPHAEQGGKCGATARAPVVRSWQQHSLGDSGSGSAALTATLDVGSTCAQRARSNSQPTPRTLAVESSARRTEHGGARRWEPASHPGPPLPASRQQSHIPGAPQMRLIRAARAHPGESSPHRSAPRAIDDGALARVYARGGRAHERGRPRWTKLTRRLLRDTAERETRPIIGGESAIRASRSQRPERSITPPLAAPPVQFDSWPSRSIEGRDYGLGGTQRSPATFLTSRRPDIELAVLPARRRRAASPTLDS